MAVGPAASTLRSGLRPLTPLLLLRSLGLPPRHPPALRPCQVLLDTGFWPDGGINFYPRWQKRSETCISSMVLAVLCWFQHEDPRVDRLADYVIAQQLTDGGWNCRAMAGNGAATHSSFHTTISALEGLLKYQRFRPERACAVCEAPAPGARISACPPAVPLASHRSSGECRR
jgi:hypothetical protein